MMKPDAHDRAYQPVTLNQARKILTHASRVYPSGLTPSQAASLLWPDKTFYRHKVPRELRPACSAPSNDRAMPDTSGPIVAGM